MSDMFQDTRSFNNDLSTWNVSNVTDFGTSFLVNSGMSSYFFDRLLLEWETLDLEDNLNFNVGSIKYHARADTARQSIITKR